MKRKGILVFFVAATLGIAAAVLVSASGFGGFGVFSRVKSLVGSATNGSGNIITQERKTGDFTGVSVSGSINVQILKGDSISVKVQGDDNLLPNLKTEVRGGNLKIWYDGKYNSEHGITVNISAPLIESLETSGISKVSFDGAQAKNIKASLSGVSKIRLSGTADSVDLQMSGASSVDAIGLKVGKLRVEGSGASRASAEVTETLDADLSGASSVSYKGTPSKITKDLSGGSQVESIN
ncbi:MAG: head GIN domain-containing protein [Pyrinomonadaceae bacterium]